MYNIAHQGAFAGTGYTADANQLTEWNIDADVFQVVQTGFADLEFVSGFFSWRVERMLEWFVE